MTGYGLYRVVGPRRYRDHDPGTLFEALIDPTVEHRVVGRGDIELICRTTPGLVPGSYRFAPGWLPDEPMQQSIEAPTGASLVPEEET